MTGKTQIATTPSPVSDLDASRLIRSVALLVATVGFSVLLAAKDLIFRYLALSGWTSSKILTASGLGCLLSTTAVSLLYWMSGDRTAFKVKNLRLQVIRLLVAGLSSYFIARAFQHLHATSVAMTSKIYIPLLLLVSPAVGVYYSRRQRMFALLAILVIAGFAAIGRTADESAIGYVEVALAVLFVMVEYILLRKAALSESLFWIAFTPALSCTIYGLLGYGWDGASAFTVLRASEVALGAASGICLYAIYVISKYRYRLLPIGISEYPSLAAALFVLLAESLLFGWHADSRYLACLAATIGSMALTVYFRDASPPEKKVSP